MKINPIITLLLCCIIVISCKPTENKPNEFIHYLNPSIEPLKSSPAYDNAKIIKLETSSSCLISVIQQIRMTESFIFILDLEHLYSFTREGKFVAQIGRKGEGPGEYIVLNTFYIDENKKQVVIIDDYKNKLLNYDFSGNYISSVSIPPKAFQSCSNVQPTSDNKLLCFHMMDMYDTKAYSLFDLDKKTVSGQYFSYQPISVENYMLAFSWHPMAKADDEIDIIMPLCDTIYAYTPLSSSFHPKYIIETPKEMAPKNRINKKAASYNEELSRLSDEGFFTGFKGIFETDTKVLLGCNYEAMMGYFLFDKVSKTGNYHIYTWDDNTETLPFLDPTYAYENKFVSYVSTETLLSFKNIQDKDFLESIKDLKEDDNPCLILYEFK